MMEDKRIDELIKILETSNDEYTRREAAESLGEIATGSERTISALVKLLETSTDESTRWQAAESLGKIATGNERAISALVKLLETSTDESTRREAADSLGKIAGISPHLLLKPDQIASLVIDKKQWLNFIWPICVIIFCFLGLLMGTHYIFPKWQNYFLVLLINTIGWLLIYIHCLCLIFLIYRSWPIKISYAYLKKYFFRGLIDKKFTKKRLFIIMFKF